MATKEESLAELRTLLAEAFALRSEGVHRPLMMQVQRAVDRRMAMLLDTKVATQSEVLKLVVEEREKAFGAATRTFTPEQQMGTRRRALRERRAAGAMEAERAAALATTRQSHSDAA
jgi:hypothetical protein